MIASRGKSDSPQPYWHLDTLRMDFCGPQVTKLEAVTFHTLRHSTASHMAMAGVDITTIKEIMRHKSITMTLRYAHLSPEHRKAAVDALGKALHADEQQAQENAETA